jgi:phage-related protein (TIGR01555 family)
MARLDGYINANTGLGVTGRDKSIGTTFIPDVIDPQTAENIWRGDPIGARMVEMLPDEAIREGVEVCIGDHETPEYFEPEEPPAPVAAPKRRTDARGSWERRVVRGQARQRRRYDAADAKGLQEEICDHLGPGKLDALKAINTAIKNRNAYGGGAVLIGANDFTTDMRMPLDLKRVRDLTYLTPLEARELVPLFFYNDPFMPNFGKPAIYQLVPMAVGSPINPLIPARVTQIHESRLIVFDGPRVSRRQLSGSMAGWGDSIYTRTFRALRSYNTSHANVEILLSDFAQAVYKIKGLAAALLQNPNALTDAMMAIELARSICRAVVIDEGEEFERKSTSLQGYPDMLERLALNLAAAVGVPLTRLMGQSASGLNATGKGDDRFYYDQASVVQTNQVAPAYLRLVEIELAMRGHDPATINHSVAFKPLWQPTELEIAQTRKAVADADHIYYTDGVISSEEIAMNRFGGDGYSMETRIDMDARTAQMAVMPPAVDTHPEPPPLPPGAPGDPGIA